MTSATIPHPKRPGMMCFQRLVATSLMVLLVRIACGEVVTYTAPPEAGQHGLTSPLFTLRVNGKPLPVFRGPDTYTNNCFAYFDFADETVSVEIERKSGEWGEATVIRPLSKGVRFVRNGRRLTFSLAGPANLSVETDGTYTNDLLMLFANPLVPEAEKNATHRFGPGYHKEMRSINLSQGESIYIDGGAMVEGLRIDGKGRVAGRGIVVNDLRPNTNQEDWCANKITGAHLSGIIQFKTDQHGFWGCQPGGADWVIDNFKIISDGGTDDGIDPQAVPGNGVIRNCFIRVKDDCISPKVVPWFDHQRGKPCQGITVSNCVLFNTEWGCGTRIGVETAGEMRDIRYENTDVIHAGGGPEHEGALVIWGAAEGSIHDITYENIRIESVNPGSGNRVISLVVEPYNGVDHSRGLGSISKVTFRDVHFGGEAFSAMKGCELDGRVSTVSDVLFDRCTRNGQPLRDAYAARLLFLDNNVQNVRFAGGLSYTAGAGYLLVDATKAAHTASGFGKVAKNADPNVKLLAEKGVAGAALEFVVDATTAGTYGVFARTGAGWQHDYCGTVRLLVNGLATGPAWDQSNKARGGNSIHDFGKVPLKPGKNVFRFELAARGEDGWMDLAWFQAVLTAK